MKITLHEKANWKTTPDNRGIIYVGDDDVTALGRIFSPRVLLNGTPHMDGCHEFRPDEGCPDLNSERMRAIATELERLDAETAEYLMAKASL